MLLSNETDFTTGNAQIGKIAVRKLREFADRVAHFLVLRRVAPQHMLEKKQIRELPNFDRFINAKFMPAEAPAPAKK